MIPEESKRWLLERDLLQSYVNSQDPFQKPRSPLRITKRPPKVRGPQAGKHSFTVINVINTVDQLITVGQHTNSQLLPGVSLHEDTQLHKTCQCKPLCPLFCAWTICRMSAKSLLAVSSVATIN